MLFNWQVQKQKYKEEKTTQQLWNDAFMHLADTSYTFLLYLITSSWSLVLLIELKLIFWLLNFIFFAVIVSSPAHYDISLV